VRVRASNQSNLTKVFCYVIAWWLWVVVVFKVIFFGFCPWKRAAEQRVFDAKFPKNLFLA